MWLIDEQVGREVASARRTGSMSAEQMHAHDARVATREGDPRNMTRAGTTAEILVEGVLTERPDIWAQFFGGGNTTYGSIARALETATADASIREVVLRVNSPGGTVDGLWDALNAIERFRLNSGKKIRVVASKAQSAAYAIAAAAGNISAVSPASMFGSIGTAIDFVMYADTKVISITNSDSPAKRPSPETLEGRAEIVKFLDSVNALFVEAIAKGRGITTKEVTANFGRGATFVATDAKARGMIDALPTGTRSSGARAEAISPIQSAVMNIGPKWKSRCASIDEVADALDRKLGRVKPPFFGSES